MEDPKRHDDFKDYFVCSGCGGSEHRVEGIREIVGVVGGALLPLPYRAHHREGETFYVEVWSEQDLTACHADIDRLAIRAGNVSNYERALNAVINVLRGDVSRSAAWYRNVPVTLEDTLPLPAGAVRMLEDTFMAIHEG